MHANSRRLLCYTIAFSVGHELFELFLKYQLIQFSQQPYEDEEIGT